MFLNANAKKGISFLYSSESSFVLFTDPSLKDGVYKNYYEENKKILEEASNFKFKAICIIGERTNTEKELNNIFENYAYSKTIIWKNDCQKRYVYLYSNREIIIEEEIEEKITNKDFECVTPDNLIITIYKALNIDKSDVIIDLFAGSNNICKTINSTYENLYISFEIDRNIYNKVLLKNNL